LTRLGGADADVAGWVGQHYQKNFSADSEVQRCEWRRRYWDSHHPDEADEAGSGLRYLVCDDWTHIFEGRSPVTTRWVLDTTTSELVRAEICIEDNSDEGTWAVLGAGDRADLLESLLEANDMLVAFEDFEVQPWDGLPDWATDEPDRAAPGEAPKA
jgi:hypothetical protein